MTRPSFLLLSVIFLFISCANDDDPGVIQPVEEVSNFYALKVGNKWNYQYFRRSSETDLFEPMDYYQEIEVVGTSTINGEQYFEFLPTSIGEEAIDITEWKDGESRFLRDSIGYLIDLNGLIQFSNTNPQQEYLIQDRSAIQIFGILLAGTENIDVPAGSFECLVEEIYGRFKETGEPIPARDKQYFKDGVGEVFLEISCVGCDTHRWERRLVSYELVD